MAEIELIRATGYRVDRGREYWIFIDRKKVGSITIGETKVFTLPPGKHDLQLKEDWASSEDLILLSMGHWTAADKGGLRAPLSN